MTHDESNTGGASGTNSTATPYRYEWTAFGRPSRAVVEGVADATGRDPADVPSPDRSVDTETLDALLTSGRDGDGVSVSFRLDGAAVTVDSDGTLEVWPVETDPEGARLRSDSELNERLRELLDAAFENGVDVLGGWTIRNGSGLPDWDVHVTETVKARGDEALTGRGDE